MTRSFQRGEVFMCAGNPDEFVLEDRMVWVIFATRKTSKPYKLSFYGNGSIAQLNRASHYG